MKRLHTSQEVASSAAIGEAIDSCVAQLISHAEKTGHAFTGKVSCTIARREGHVLLTASVPVA